MVQHLRALFSKAANRLIVGAVVGLGMGLLSAIWGIRLSGVDVSGAAAFNQMAKLVISFAVAMAVIVACLFDFMHLYLKFIKNQEERWADKVLGRAHKLWDDEFDGLPPASSNTE